MASSSTTRIAGCATGRHRRRAAGPFDKARRENQGPRRRCEGGGVMLAGFSYKLLDQGLQGVGQLGNLLETGDAGVAGDGVDAAVKFLQLRDAAGFVGGFGKGLEVGPRRRRATPAGWAETTGAAPFERRRRNRPPRLPATRARRVASRGTAAPGWVRRVRTTSMTCLGVQLALDRHLVAPAFHAS